MILREGLLIKIGLLISILGIISIYFISVNIYQEESKINSLESNKGNQITKINGEIIDISQTEKVAYITINRIVPTKIILFKKGNLSLKKGMNVNVEVEETNQGIEEEYVGHEVIMFESKR